MKAFFSFCTLFYSLIIFGQPAISLPSGYTWVQMGSSSYQNGPYYTGNASGNSAVTCCGGGSTTCGSADTSFGGETQCSSVPWTVVGTPGANFIQSQLYGNIGTCDNNLAGLAVPCNPGVGGTGAGTNWPSSTSETRRVTLTNWMNTNPSSTISSLPLAERTSGTVWLPTSAQLRILDDGVGNGTGAGADELRLTMIGGDDGSCSSWQITAAYNLSLEVSGAYGAISGVNGMKIDQSFNQQLSNIPNATGSNAYNATNGNLHTCCNSGCSFQAVSNSWYFPGGVNTASFGVGYTANYNILSSLVEDGSTFDIDFTSEQSIGISRTGGSSGDARATMGPGMGGKADLLVNYQIWVIQAPAPVTLKSFNVSKINSQSFLQWVVTSETNNEGWIIQRSNDGITWGDIDFVVGKGNSNELTTYQATDKSPNSGINYYRLKQMDFDGRFSFSHIESAEFNLGADVKLFPNPTTGLVQVSSISGLARFKVFNSSGTMVAEGMLDNEHGTIDLSQMNTGLYIIRLIADQEITNTKILKQ